jgi:hypothetical protein
MGLAAWFSTFCDNLGIENESDISYRYRRITRQLNTDFWNTTSETANSLYVGSYGRNTAVQGFSDLDMIFELPGSLYASYDAWIGNGQSGLLQAVRTSMRKTYPSSDTGADGQVVSVSFTDGMTFEVVPVFVNIKGTYTFPDSNDGGRWRETDPRAEIRAIRDRNDECNKNLVPLCRMLRAWKQSWDVPIGGLLIDTLAYQFIENWAHRKQSYLYYDYMCRDCFDWMATQDKEQEFWRAPGSGQYVMKRGLFQYKARQCCNLAKEAITRDGGSEAGVVSQAKVANDFWKRIPRLTTLRRRGLCSRASCANAMVASCTRTKRTRSAPTSYWVALS